MIEKVFRLIVVFGFQRDGFVGEMFVLHGEEANIFAHGIFRFQRERFVGGNVCQT